MLINGRYIPFFLTLISLSLFFLIDLTLCLTGFYSAKKRIDSCDSPEASVFVMFNHVADLVSFNRTFISSVTAATVVLGLLRKVAIFGN